MDVYSVPWEQKTEIQWENVKCDDQESVANNLVVLVNISSLRLFLIFSFIQFKFFCWCQGRR